jgi:hypothetical protein
MHGQHTPWRRLQRLLGRCTRAPARCECIHAPGCAAVRAAPPGMAHGLWQGDDSRACVDMVRTAGEVGDPARVCCSRQFAEACCDHPPLLPSVCLELPSPPLAIDPLEVDESLLSTLCRESASHEDPLGKNRRRPCAPCIEPCSYWRTAVPAVCFQADDDVLEPIYGTHPTI